MATVTKDTQGKIRGSGILCDLVGLPLTASLVLLLPYSQLMNKMPKVFSSLLSMTFSLA